MTSAYSEFDGQMGDWVKEMFAAKRIDARGPPGEVQRRVQR